MAERVGGTPGAQLALPLERPTAGGAHLHPDDPMATQDSVADVMTCTSPQVPCEPPERPGASVRAAPAPRAQVLKAMSDSGPLQSINHVVDMVETANHCGKRPCTEPQARITTWMHAPQELTAIRVADALMDQDRTLGTLLDRERHALLEQATAAWLDADEPNYSAVRALRLRLQDHPEHARLVAEHLAHRALELLCNAGGCVPDVHKEHAMVLVTEVAFLTRALAGGAGDLVATVGTQNLPVLLRALNLGAQPHVGAMFSVLGSTPDHYTRCMAALALLSGARRWLTHHMLAALVFSTFEAARRDAWSYQDFKSGMADLLVAALTPADAAAAEQDRLRALFINPHVVDLIQHLPSEQQRALAVRLLDAHLMSALATDGGAAGVPAAFESSSNDLPRSVSDPPAGEPHGRA